MILKKLKQKSMCKKEQKTKKYSDKKKQEKHESLRLKERKNKRSFQTNSRIDEKVFQVWQVIKPI